MRRSFPKRLRLASQSSIARQPPYPPRFRPFMGFNAAPTPQWLQTNGDTCPTPFSSNLPQYSACVCQLHTSWCPITQYARAPETMTAMKSKAKTTASRPMYLPAPDEPKYCTTEFRAASLLTPRARLAWEAVGNVGMLADHSAAGNDYRMIAQVMVSFENR